MLYKIETGIQNWYQATKLNLVLPEGYPDINRDVKVERLNDTPDILVDDGIRDIAIRDRFNSSKEAHYWLIESIERHDLSIRRNLGGAALSVLCASLYLALINKLVFVEGLPNLTAMSAPFFTLSVAIGCYHARTVQRGVYLHNIFNRRLDAVDEYIKKETMDQEDSVP